VGTAAAVHKARQADRTGGILCEFARFLLVTRAAVPRQEFPVIDPDRESFAARALSTPRPRR